jgi:hypothetical protein
MISHRYDIVSIDAIWYGIDAIVHQSRQWRIDKGYWCHHRTHWISISIVDINRTLVLLDILIISMSISIELCNSINIDS